MRLLLTRIAVAIALTSVAYAQVPSVAESSRVILAAELSADQIIPGQQVFISVRLKNISPDVVKMTDTYPAFDFPVEMTDMSGKPVPPLKSRSTMVALRNAVEDLALGEGKLAVLRLAELYRLDTPGDYKLVVARAGIFGPSSSFEQASAIPMILRISSGAVSSSRIDDPWLQQRRAQLALFAAQADCEATGPVGDIAVSQYEPVVAPLTILNRSRSIVNFETGQAPESDYRVEVRRPNGETARLFVPDWADDPVGSAAGARVKLLPGMQYVGQTLLSEWVRFDTVGRYEGRIRIPNCTDAALVNVTVLPFNPKRLDETLAQLAKDARASDPRLLSLRALASTGIEQAVPFLEQLAKNGDSGALRGLSRIDSPTAVDALAGVRANFPSQLMEHALQSLRSRSNSQAVRDKIDSILGSDQNKANEK